MTTALERDKLIAALRRGKINPSDENILRLDQYLRGVVHRHALLNANRLKTSPKSHESLALKITAVAKIGETAAAILDTLYVQFYPEFYLFDRQLEDKLVAIRDIKRIAEEVIDFLTYENEILKGEHSQSREQPISKLYVELYTIYTSLSGRTGYSPKGPFPRFVEDCLPLIDSNLRPASGNSICVTLRNSLRRRSDEADALAKQKFTIIKAPARYGVPIKTYKVK